MHLTTGAVEEWAAVNDERSWFDYTHAVEREELVIYQHTFRRVRQSAGNGRDHLLWKHHTTKVARHYAPGEWKKVSRVRKQTPPTSLENVPRVVRERERRPRVR